MLQISASEQTYILDGIEANIRADGRDRLTYRALNVETSLLTQSNGSARVFLENAGTDIIASVKLEAISPASNTPKSGDIQVHVSCCSSVSSQLSGRDAEGLSTRLSQLMTRLLCSSSSTELEKYCIIEGVRVWSIQVDVMVFQSSGNLPDLISMAVYAALNDTVFPSVNVVGVEGEDKTITVQSDPAAGYPMGAAHFPICVSLCKVGNFFLTDPMQEEELCMSAQLHVAVNQSGIVCGVQKTGEGTIDVKEMQVMIDEAHIRSKLLFRVLHTALESQKQLDASYGRKVERMGLLEN